MKPLANFFKDTQYPTVDEIKMWVYYYVLIELRNVWPEDDWLTLGGWDVNIWKESKDAKVGNVTIYHASNHDTGITLMRGV